MKYYVAQNYGADFLECVQEGFLYTHYLQETNLFLRTYV